jgi:glycosyltransferase involved in cell wall biosynthesis
MELARATWISDVELAQLRSARPSPLRRLWAHYFRMLSKIAYHRASLLVTLSDVNRAKQIADGADPAKIVVVPNGVECAQAVEAVEAPPAKEAIGQDGRKLRIGFVGRIVPIKDVITLVKAIAICREQVEVEVWMIGPEDEDADYARRCHALAAELGLGETIKWLGRQPMAQMYPKIDVLLLTSIGEGQPLVILEAYAYGIPAIVTDVGCCRELVEGGDSDRALGPSGICTRIASPRETAAAITRLAKDPDLRARMGMAARARVTARYQFKELITSYESVYSRMTG